MRAKLIILILKLTARLPLRFNHWLGTLAGKLMMLVNNEQKRVASINITRCFPELTHNQHQQLLQQCLIETGKTFFEIGHIWLSDKAHFLDLIQEVHGEEHLQRGLAKGKGLIFVSPHLGNWEVMGLYLSVSYPLTSLYRPPRLEGIGTLVRQARERLGAKLVPTDAKGIRALYQALSRNEAIGILPDQDPREAGGQFAPFFDIPANTMTLLSRLANKSHATVLCSYAERLPQGRGFAIHFEPAPTGLYDADLETSLTALNQMVERSVRRIPAQYQWGYKRFRTRPEGEKDFYVEV